MLNRSVTVQSVVRDVQLLLWVNIYECGSGEGEKNVFFIKPLKTSLVFPKFYVSSVNVLTAGPITDCTNYKSLN
jgi:hypothetical protein